MISKYHLSRRNNSWESWVLMTRMKGQVSLRHEWRPAWSQQLCLFGLRIWVVLAAWKLELVSDSSIRLWLCWVQHSTGCGFQEQDRRDGRVMVLREESFQIPFDGSSCEQFGGSTAWSWASATFGCWGCERLTLQRDEQRLEQSDTIRFRRWQNGWGWKSVRDHWFWCLQRCFLTNRWASLHWIERNSDPTKVVEQSRRWLHHSKKKKKKTR